MMCGNELKTMRADCGSIKKKLSTHTSGVRIGLTTQTFRRVKPSGTQLKRSYDFSGIPRHRPKCWELFAESCKYLFRGESRRHGNVLLKEPGNPFAQTQKRRRIGGSAASSCGQNVWMGLNVFSVLPFSARRQPRRSRSRRRSPRTYQRRRARPVRSRGLAGSG